MNNPLPRIHAICRNTLAAVFLYHGIVPKLLWPSSTELALAQVHPLPFISAQQMSQAAAVGEIVLALALLFWRRSLLPVHFAALLLIVLLIDVAIVAPALIIEAFNPLSLNTACLALCWVIHLSQNASRA